MDVTRSYVIRIYRQDPDALTGLIESVETGEIHSFRSVAQLCHVLSHPLPLRRLPLFNSTDKEQDP